jgi:hypothetical protein
LEDAEKQLINGTPEAYVRREIGLQKEKEVSARVIFLSFSKDII